MVAVKGVTGVYFSASKPRCERNCIPRNSLVIIPDKQAESQLEAVSILRIAVKR